VILDGHIHIWDGPRDREGFERCLYAGGIDGGVILSLPPSGSGNASRDHPPAERLDDLFFWCEGRDHLYPFYWIDPIMPDAIAQVTMAVERGVMGFKVACDRYEPGDPRAMQTFRAVAQAGRPILFHSGILWDGKPSSMYNRPAAFEVLLEVEGLRFCLAHIGWPWCDEMIAVYGKFWNALTRSPGLSAEMFIDITPGTPPIYRRDALTKLFGVGYDVEHNVIFGSDCSTSAYNVDEWLDRDAEILQELGITQETWDGLYGNNLLRFLGLSPDTAQKQPL
jgi:predicted TIM-barrel fold metal-dependent hydrolase